MDRRLDASDFRSMTDEERERARRMFAAHEKVGGPMSDPKDTGKEQRDEPVSLAPLDAEEALRALLAVKGDEPDGSAPEGQPS